MSGTWNNPRIVEEKKVLKNDREENSNNLTLREKQEFDAFARTELFDVEHPTRSLDDLIVPEHTSEGIYGLIAKVIYKEKLYKEWGLEEIDPHGNRAAINLYGPPGTGKSFCAEAIANYLRRGIIRINYAEIESKYVGDTPKNIKAAFAKAKEHNAILFFDEADSILGKRLTNVTQSADHGVNVSRSVMLMELDRFDGITIFATNLFTNYDRAFVRRILGHVEMPLPDFDGRKQLWQYHIPTKMPTNPAPFTESEYSYFSEISEGLSGGDILNAVINAATYAVQRNSDEQYLTSKDLMRSIEAILKAKKGVVDQVEVSKEIPLSEAPPSVIEHLNKLKDKSDKDNNILSEGIN